MQRFMFVLTRYMRSPPLPVLPAAPLTSPCTRLFLPVFARIWVGRRRRSMLAAAVLAAWCAGIQQQQHMDKTCTTLRLRTCAHKARDLTEAILGAWDGYAEKRKGLRVGASNLCARVQARSCRHAMHGWTLQVRPLHPLSLCFLFSIPLVFGCCVQTSRIRWDKAQHCIRTMEGTGGLAPL